MAVTDGRQARRHELRREMILRAAAEEFALQGFVNATLDRIGERIGLSKASLYYYVNSKEELLAVILEQVTSRIAEEAAQVEGSAEERLRAFVRAHVTVGATSVEGQVLGENVNVLLDREAHERFARARQKHEQRLAALIHEGVEAGEFRSLPVGPAVKLMFGALNSIPVWFRLDGRLTLEQLADEVVGWMLEGLAGPPTDPHSTT